MRTFAQKQQPMHKTKSASSARFNRVFSGQSREVSSILHLQRAIGNQAVQRLLQAKTEESEVGSATTTVSSRFLHNFSQIPLHPKAHTTIQPKVTVNKEKPTIRKGESGVPVTTLQNMLNAQDIGVPLTPDGQFGLMTQKAVINFQSLRGLATDGVVGPLTWTALDGGAHAADNQVPLEGGGSAARHLPLDEVLEVGSKGDAVKLAQGLLNGLGAQLEVDGAFGWITYGSVGKFQRVNGLAETGCVDRDDWLRLGSGNAKTLVGDNAKEDGQPGIKKGFGGATDTTSGSGGGTPSGYQWTSWVNPESPRGGKIGQIYFPTGSAELDDEDLAELQKIRRYRRAFTHPDWDVPYLFFFVGYADHRRIDGGNEALTLRRAAMVENDVVINRLGPRPDKYRTAHRAVGADPDSKHGDLAGRLAQARRVDIYAEAPVYPPEKTDPPEPGHDWCEEWSDRWSIRIDGSLSVAYKHKVGAEVYGFFVKDLKNGYFQGMRYVGIGAFPGPAPISYAGPSPWQDFTTSRIINIRHFQGFAQHFGAIDAVPGAQNIVYDKFVLNGPSYKGANYVELDFVSALKVGSDTGNNFGEGFAFTTGGLHIVDGPEKP